MYSHRLHSKKVCLSALLFLVLTGILSLSAQSQRVINDADRVTLHGNTHPLARAEFDRGFAAATLPMNHIIMLLSCRPAAMAVLAQLLTDLHISKAPIYHKWFTPAQ